MADSNQLKFFFVTMIILSGLGLPLSIQNNGNQNYMVINEFANKYSNQLSLPETDYTKGLELSSSHSNLARDLDPDELGLVTSDRFDKEEYITKHRRYNETYKAENIVQPDAYTASALININNNSELMELGLDGSGTTEDPFVISNYSFTTINRTAAISIANTDLYLRIETNKISQVNGSGNTLGGIIFDNVSNIDFIGNQVFHQNSSRYMRGMVIENSSNITISTNSFDYIATIIIENSSSIQFISNNHTTFTNSRNVGLAVSDSTNIDIAHNRLGFSVSSTLTFKNKVLSESNIRVYSNTMLGPARTFALDPDQNLLLSMNIDLVIDFHFFSNIVLRSGRNKIWTSSNLNFVDNTFQDAVVDNWLLFFGATAQSKPSNNTIISHNKFINTESQPEAIPNSQIFFSGTNFSIFKNIFEASKVGAIIISDGNIGLIEFNNIYDQRLDGILFSLVNKLIIRNNTISGIVSGGGIVDYINRDQPNSGSRDLGTFVLIQENDVQDTDNAIDIDSTGNLSIIDNQVYENTIGIRVVGRSNIEIRDNEVYDNVKGMVMGSLIDSSVVTNNFIQNDYGLVIDNLNSKTTKIIGNLFQLNSQSGIHITDSNITEIYNNTFDGNFRNGISLEQSFVPVSISIRNNIFANHTQSGAFALNLQSSLSSQFSSFHYHKNYSKQINY